MTGPPPLSTASPQAGPTIEISVNKILPGQTLVKNGACGPNGNFFLTGVAVAKLTEHYE